VTTTLLTGGTGFLGRRLLRALLRRGERVVALVRAPDDDAARARLLAATGPLDDGSSLVVVAADLSARLPLARIADLGPYDHVWHLAALLDLGAQRRRALFEANVRATARVVRLAAAVGRGRFHHLSTAYRCGIVDGPVLEEAPVRCRGFRNEYERTKQAAEGLVRRAMARGLPATIYRPSIVVGDARTGATDVFGAFYQVARVYHAARDLAPLVVPGDPDVPLDIVPADGVVEALLALSVHPDAIGRTLHLTNPDPPRLRDLVAVGNERGWSRVEAIRDAPLDDLPWPTPAVMRPARAMLPYLSDQPVFDRTNTDRLLGHGLPAFGEGPREALARLVSYAIAAAFGVDAETAARERRILERLGVGRAAPLRVPAP
jgi:thioester reductase-like protein